MILRRLGNKKKIAAKIAQHFPAHEAYIEPFFGAGGMFFNKSRAKYNACNDIDSDVFNLFMVVRERASELEEAFRNTPIDDNLWQYWRKNEETDPIYKAIRFLHLSSFGYMGKPDTLHGKVFQDSLSILDKIYETQEAIRNVLFFSCDFEEFLKKQSFRPNCNEESKTIIYCDPPYLLTTNNYAQGFAKQDTDRLFRVCREMAEKGCSVAISEFDNPEVCAIAESYGFNKILIAERKTMKNRNTEVLFTSYQSNQLTLF